MYSIGEIMQEHIAEILGKREGETLEELQSKEDE